MIKAAQDKEELQRYGDKLDQDIKKAEAENDALLNTVRLVKLKNKKMNDALSPANIENSEEAKDLDMKMKAAQEKHKFRKNQLQDLQKQVQDLKEAIEYGDHHEKQCQEKFAVINHELMQLDRSIVDQKMKMDRVTKMLEKIDRAKLNEHQKIDILYKEVKDLSTGAGRQLQQILKGQDEQVVSVAYSMLQQMGIEPESILSRAGSTVHWKRFKKLKIFIYYRQCTICSLIIL